MFLQMLAWMSMHSCYSLLVVCRLSASRRLWSVPRYRL